jgi:hypothetical protein
LSQPIIYSKVDRLPFFSILHNHYILILQVPIQLDFTVVTMMFVKTIVVLAFAILSLATPIIDRMFFLIIMPLNKLNRLHPGAAEVGDSCYADNECYPGIKDLTQ